METKEKDQKCWHIGERYNTCSNKVQYKLKYGDLTIFICGKHLHSIIKEHFYQENKIQIEKIV